MMNFKVVFRWGQPATLSPHGDDPADVLLSKFLQHFRKGSMVYCKLDGLPAYVRLSEIAVVIPLTEEE